MVSTATAIHLSQLTRVVVQEAVRQAELIARQIYAQTSRALQRTPGADPLVALREDPELRSFLDASVGYSPHLVYALVTDRTGTVLLHTERQKEGKPEPERPSLDGLLKLDTLSRFSALYTAGRTYETVLPMTLNGGPFGSIRLGRVDHAPAARGHRLAPAEPGGGRGRAAAGLAGRDGAGAAHAAADPRHRGPGGSDPPRRAAGGRAGGASAATSSRSCPPSSSVSGASCRRTGSSTLSEKAHLQRVVDQLEDGVIFLNPERHILFFNRAAEAVVGLPLERAVGLPIHEVLDPAHPLRPSWTRCWSAPTGIRNATVVLPHEGRDKEFLVSAFPMEDARRVMGAVVLLKDLESVKTVQSLVSYSAKLAALGRLTSGVAHEVKNPLNAMMIHVELLKERLEDSAADVQQSLEVIGSEIRRLDRVVQGFLKLHAPAGAHAQGGRSQRAARRACARWWRRSGQSHGVRFVLELDADAARDERRRGAAAPGLPQHPAERGQAMPTGGAVRVRTRPRGARVGARDGRRTRAWGSRRRTWTRSSSSTTRRKAEGSGIGLSVVYRIMQLHDGAIEAKSEPGRGTTMIVRLPLRGGA